jgi:hypothetical protein
MPRKLPDGVTKEPITVRVKASTATRLRVAAALRPANSRTMGDVVDELVERHLDEAPTKKTTKR